MTYDVSTQLGVFYNDHVRLGQVLRAKLAASRDNCLDRLADGLVKLGQERRQAYASFVDNRDQGSYTMHTLNQARNNNYDIDVAVIFEHDALPTTALEARRRIADALVAGGGNFRRKPEARTNAVTVWYAEGHHVDLAIYRRSTDFFGGRVLEHAGPSWVKRDPDEVTGWFADKVKRLSPSSSGIAVEEQQLRRIVRFIKAFARSRDGWQLPGGMLLTKLVTDCYMRDDSRDDVALYKTISALKKRLDGGVDVQSPVGSTPLTNKPARRAEVRRFLEKLDLALIELSVLEDSECKERDALTAWQWFFRHDFWGELKAGVDEDVADAEDIEPIDIEVGLANEENGRIQRPYLGPAEALPKGKWLKFVPRGASADSQYRWTCRNTGDEARAAGQEKWTRVGHEQWRPTAFRGIHSMTCELVQNGVVVGRGVRRVRVGPR